VHLVCKVVPGHGVRWLIAVPHQNVAFEHFDQTGAAVHPALCRNSSQPNLSKHRVWSIVFFKELGKANPGLVGVYFS
jgi:hypothetical protein